ncbi:MULTISPECIES: hypothetical protein [unclassified Clostridioides]|uniref:hypothetical protein n=1 Tax=unclassified Clostridioides TaxID=2635829 RepID=UPI001D0CCF6F|nr:hypothetical protein [Clostridioides sp. ES-S-0001-03]MCC0670425.1 hypothetical protein [Clostridioides sp. ES-S-0145-01]MCC0703287.1 hypothetical protein [Clostridioides sp. ES-S-0049-02]MCC0765216.1 hypothetical protein [Clostridioides sp. ES-S-0006-03]UDN57388.1 hypothetical protein JJC01_14560 [Clostridioides sp. ES-S-0010-02]UDN63019.1 hypothetical protein IC758_06065 [Clostridioides sp. ES-W-0016-02]
MKILQQFKPFKYDAEKDIEYDEKIIANQNTEVYIIYPRISDEENKRRWNELDAVAKEIAINIAMKKAETVES